MTPHGKAHNRTHTEKLPMNSHACKPGHGTTRFQKPKVESSSGVHFHPTRDCALQGRIAVECCETKQRDIPAHPGSYGVASAFRHGARRLLTAHQPKPAADRQRDRHADHPSQQHARVMLSHVFPPPISGAGRLPHCAAALQVRSIVLLVGVGPCSNRAHCRHRGQGEREEQLFFESRRARRPLDLVSPASRCGRTSRQPFCLNARVALSAPRTSTSPATASLPMKRSWSSWTNCGRASGLEMPRSERSFAHKVDRKSHGDRNPVDVALVTAGETATNSVRPLPSSALKKDHLKGDASPTVGMKGLASSATRQQRSNREARSAQGPALNLNTPRGVRYSSQGSLRKGRKHFGADDRSLAALSARLVQSALDPATGADTAAAPGLTDPPVAAAVNFIVGWSSPGSNPAPATICDRRAV